MKNLLLKTKIFLAGIFLLLSESSYSQIKDTRSAIGISIPVILNNSEATYYNLGSPRYPNGRSVSNGVNINYSHTLNNNLYGKIGIGYFNQFFKIVRPFNYYDNPGQLLYSTQSYNYNNVQLFAGFGYIKEINRNEILNGYISYSYFNSFNQKYLVKESNKVWQVNKKSLPLGEMINFEIGIQRSISKTISLGANLVIPLYTHWNKDKIFINSFYSNDEQQIARTRFSIGAALSCYYNF